MADEALKHALETGENPERTSPIFDDSSDDDGIDTYDEHQMKMRKEGKELIKKFFKHRVKKEQEAAKKEKAAAKKAVSDELKKKKEKKPIYIEMKTMKKYGGKRKRKTRKRKRKRRRKRKTRKKRKVKRRLTKKRR